MNAMTMRDMSRTKLSPSYNTIHLKAMSGTPGSPAPMSSAELQRLVASMID